VRKENFDHVIAAAVEVSGEQEIVVIGSQAILGSVEEPAEVLLESMEVDLFPLGDLEKAIEIEAALGEGSSFQGLYGYYAHGVGPETMKGPAGWRDRLIRVKVPPRPGQEAEPIALCLELHDLVLAKCAAGRSRDWDYAREMLRLRLVDYEVLIERIDEMPGGPDHQDAIREMLAGIASQVARNPGSSPS
jgi:hypothetical protein